MGEAKNRRAHAQSADHGPIEPEFHDLMNALAQALDSLLNGEGCPAGEKKIGFFLTTFKFGEEGRFNYISNADRLDVRVMLKDITARIEARMQPPGHA